jgi:sugar (pentulose or hexulose) kinase
MPGKSQTFLMGLDLGTSALKGVVMDARGEVLATEEEPSRYLEPKPDWFETDPIGHRRDVFGLIRRLASTAPGPIRALAACAASGNTLLADTDGTPQTYIINWMDRRTADHPPAVLGGLTPESVRQVVGWPCVDIFPLAHLGWIRENQPDILDRTPHVGMNTDWLLFLLTGNWLMDHSTATSFHLQDQLARRYHRPFLDRLGIPESKLSRLVRSGVSAGRITAEAAAATGLATDTEVVTGCFDHPAAARAVGVLEPGRLMLSCGTSWVGFFGESDRAKVLDAGLLCDPFLTDRGGPWGAMFSVPYIGRTIDIWVHEVIAPWTRDPYAVFNAAAAAAPPGAGGLRIDLRRPVEEPVSDTPENVSRAVMEGAARLLADQVEALRRRGFRFDEAVIVGGLSRSPVWSEIVAGTAGLALTAGTAHSGARGAAMLAGIGAGLFEDEREAWERCGSHTPPPNAKEPT